MTTHTKVTIVYNTKEQKNVTRVIYLPATQDKMEGAQEYFASNKKYLGGTKLVEIRYGRPAMYSR